ncbi:GNAT family N-acetyltransferase [Actinophytocola sediminis]
MTDLVVRPLAPGEHLDFHQLTDPALIDAQTEGRDYNELAALGQYRPEWTWVAQRDGRTLARAAWWGAPSDTTPKALDWLDFTPDGQDAAVEILRAANLDAEYALILPPRWRADPAVKAAGDARIAVAERAGMRRFVERLRYRWTPADGIPAAPGRLRFEPEPDDDRIRAALAQIIVGSLDAHQRADVASGGLDAAVREDMEFLHWMPSPREWWRLAYTPDGDLVGLTVPGRNYGGPVIGIIGVVPGQRGHGYAFDLLVEATRILQTENAGQITAETDTTNTPMAATFARAGYPISQERVYLK